MSNVGRRDSANKAHSEYRHRREATARAFTGNTEQIYLDKRTTSNLFRYAGRHRAGTRAVALREFNHVLSLDPVNQTLEVEGLATYETIVAHCIGRGFLPTVTPELKHITIGGATVGIGIESTGHRHGFVHDGLIEADVLLPGGEIVTCRADNDHADLFRALPNSYGTLGYILRAEIRLVPVKRYVELRNVRFTDIGAYLDAMAGAVAANQEYIEGLFYSDSELYLTLGRPVDEVPRLDGIYGTNIYHKTVRSRADLFLKTEDYIFRFDPDWFWNIPETGVYHVFRRFAPPRLRSSGTYSRYVARRERVERLLRRKPDTSREQLIQDWEVPWERGAEFVRFLLDSVDIEGRPWAAIPIKSPASPTLYPVEAGRLYLNIGCYCFTERPKPDEDYFYTKLLDAKCFELGGLKMLYSSTFLDRHDFDRIYNGDAYLGLKHRYDPNGNAPTLFEKAVRAR